jgi:hypothetical protein
MHKALEQIDEWERRQHDELDRKVSKAREEVAPAKQSVQQKLDGKG